MKPFFYICIRFGDWMITRQGLFRWSAFTAAKPMRNGKRAKREGWKRVFPNADVLARGDSANPTES